MVEEDCFFCSITMSRGCARCRYTGVEPPTAKQKLEMIERAEKTIREDEESAAQNRLVWCQLWTIHDRDSPADDQLCSLHTTEQKRKEFIKAYHKKMPAHPPTVYYGLSRFQRYGKIIPPYRCRLDEKTYERVVNSGIGMWCVTIPVETQDAVAFIPSDDFMPFHEGLTGQH